MNGFYLTSSNIHYCIFSTLLRIRPIGLFQFRIIFEIMNHRQMVGLLGRMISSSQGLCLHRVTQHRQTRTNVHAVSGIRTREPKARAATGSATTVFVKKSISLIKVDVMFSSVQFSSSIGDTSLSPTIICLNGFV
jgi:hypothetical protein